MSLPFRPLCILTFAAGVAAQSTVVPTGYTATEGESFIQQFPLGGRNYVQQIHGGAIGPRTIAGLAWRRDGQSTTPFASPSQQNITVRVGVGDPSRVSSVPNDNFIGGPTVVFDGIVALPDWQSVPAAAPAPFDFVITFTQPWALPAGPGFTWDLASFFDNLNGADMVPEHAGTNGVTLGQGCSVVLPMTARGWMLALAPTNELVTCFAAGGLRAVSPAVLLLGGSDPQLAVPGLCAALRTDVIGAVPTSTDWGGNAKVQWQQAFNPALAGRALLGQFATLDPRISPLPFGLTNGVAQSVPTPRPAPDGATVVDEGSGPQVLRNFAIVTELR
ncbi:MAG: hypothetical protein AAF628_35065 [Planctomycetota bacterium]